MIHETDFSEFGFIVNRSRGERESDFFFDSLRFEVKLRALSDRNAMLSRRSRYTADPSRNKATRRRGQ